MPFFLHYRLFGGIKIKFKMRITKAIFLLGLIIILFFSLPFSFLLNKKLAYYCYKEVVYRTIINNLVGKEKEPEKVSLVLLNYFHQYLFTPVEAVVIDKDVYSDLMRGVAWCDQRSWALGTFLGKIGIDNRMVMTRNGEGVSNHTVTEVFINKRWRFLDPMYGFVIKDDNGELASYEDICRHPYLFYLGPSMLMLKEIEPGKYTKVKDFFIRNIFYSHPINPIIWKNPVSGKDPKRKALAKILDFYIFLFGNKFSYRYQDIYLKYFSPGDKSDRIFFMARNYDLIDRYQSAVEMYKNFIDNFPGNADSENALFFLGALYNREKEFGLSVDILRALLIKYPQTKWKRVARYYIGYGYELSGNHKLAEEYYWQALDMYKQLGAEEALAPGELKVIRRLYGLLNASKKRGEIRVIR